MDVASFLAEVRPFDELDVDGLARVVAHTQIEHFAPGTVILDQAGAPARFLYVVRKGAVEILDQGRVIDTEGEGEVFGIWSLLGAVAPTATVRTTEDTLCYLVDAEVATELLETRSGTRLIADSSRRRLTHADGRRTSLEDSLRLRSVGSLVQRPPIIVEPTTAVADAAALMARERVASVLARRGDGTLGILTDRDLRTKIVAERRSGDTPVGDVMTVPARTVPPDAMAGDVLLRMLSEGVHHFPVTDGGGTVVGVVTDTDLMDVERRSPFALKSAIQRAADRDALVAHVREVPDVVVALDEASVDPIDVGRVVAFLIDAATARLLELALEELGEPPGAWSWLAFGSAARHEQALHTDQDHALAFEGGDEMESHAARMAEFVTSGLEAAGIPRCEGNAMATNPLLRREIPAFVEQFREWMRDLGSQGSERLSIVFDYRRVVGTVAIDDALDELIRSAPRDPAFVKHLKRRALDLRPPTGFVRDFVVEAHGEHAGRLDIKHRGIVIVANLARGWSIGAGLTATGTLERLAAASAAGALDADLHEELAETFRFLWRIRLRHQVEQHLAGATPDDFVDPRELGPITRRSLKEAFRVIARAQKALAADLGVSVR